MTMAETKKLLDALETAHGLWVKSHFTDDYALKTRTTLQEKITTTLLPLMDQMARCGMLDAYIAEPGGGGSSYGIKSVVINGGFQLNADFTDPSSTSCHEGN